MGEKKLRDWAVMNYSPADRGEQPQETQDGHGLPQRDQTDSVLSGNLSYFGVRRSMLILLLLSAHTNPVRLHCAALCAAGRSIVYSW